MSDSSGADRRALVADVLSWTALFLINLYFLGLKSFSFHWESGDEAIYAYMSWAALDHGAIPYRDYFFSHPLFQLVWSIPHFAIWGFTGTTVKAIPIAASCLTSVFLFLICKKRIGNVAAVVGSLFFLNTFSLLRSSGYWTGVHESVLLATIGLWFYFSKRSILAGIFLALGVGTGTYILPAALLVGLLCYLEGNESFKKYRLSFFSIWFATQMVGTLLGGANYWKAVYLYHFQKPEARQPAWRDTVQHFFQDFSLFWLGFFGFGLSLFQGFQKNEKNPKKRNPFLLIRIRNFMEARPAETTAWIGAAWSLGYLVFLQLLKKRFSFYYQLVYPGLVLGLGFLAQQFYVWLKDSVKGLNQSNLALDRRNLALRSFVIFLICLGYLLYTPAFKSFNSGFFRKRDQTLVWKDSPFKWANSFFKFCCWSNVALEGKLYSNPQEILLRQPNMEQRLRRLAEFVKNNSHPDDTLFGDSITVGIVALLSERRLERDFADTNTMRFTSKITPAEEAIREIDNPTLKYVLVNSQKVVDKKTGQERTNYQRFASIKEFRKWLDSNFKVAFSVPSGKNGAYLLLERIR